MSLALEEFTDWVQRSLDDKVDEIMRRSANMSPGDIRTLVFHYLDEDDDVDLEPFLQKWPDVSEHAFRLAFGLVKTAYLTAAMFPVFSTLRADMGRSLLLTMAVSLDPWRFGGQLVSANDSKTIKAVVESLGGRSEIAEAVMGLLEDRVRPLHTMALTKALRLVYRYVVFVPALEAGIAIYNDGIMYPEEFAQIELLQAERGWAVTRFMAKYNWLDDDNAEKYSQTMVLLQECLGLSAYDEESEFVGQDPSAKDIILLFPTLQERIGLLACLITVLRSAGTLSRQAVEMCYLMGQAIEVPDAMVQDLLAE